MARELLGNIKGQKGDKGEKGDKGDKGDPGIDISNDEVIQARGNYPILKDRLDITDSQLGQIVDSVDSDLSDIRNTLSQTYLLDKLYSVLNLFNMPSGFPMTTPFTVYTSLSGKVVLDYDVSVNKNSVNKRYYVDVNNGVNSNDGSETTPFKTLERAFRYGDADEIILKAGIYDWSNGTVGTVPISNQKKTFNLIGEGDVYLGAHRGYQTWTLVEGQSNVYHTSVSSVIEVIDIRNYSSPLFYEKMNSISEVAGKSGAYYINGSDVYVRTTNNAKPNEKILLNMNNNALQLDDFENIYMENIKFTNTFTMFNTNTLCRLYAKNCDFMFGTGDNTVSIWGEVYSIFQNCRAMYAERDGFNYHVRKGKLPRGIEIDCIGAYNGRDGGNSNNGSTIHDGGTILRINGEYHHNHGPNIIDVNLGTKSLNIGVYSHHSTATTSLSNVDFRTRDDVDMWLVNCISNGSDFSTSVEGNANLYKENSLLIGKEFVG